MNIFKLSLKNMVARPLSTVLSLILLTLGAGIISLLLLVNRHISQQMETNIQGIDMVVGAKGSPLQLVLSAVYHIDAPTGNIPLKEANKLKRNGLIAAAIPLSYGDSFKGYRIVGTDHQYPALYGGKVTTGRLWKQSFEVTLGATVAANLNLKTGDTFSGMHGLGADGEVHEAHPYRVVGIFDHTNSVLDQLILTASESVWEVHDHQHEAGHHDEEQHVKEEDREITAMLIKFRSPMGMVRLPRMINKNTNMQAAVPVYEISRLFDLMGIGIETLTALAFVIMAVSGLSVFISLYTALKDRQYEMALMRTYGASRLQLACLVIQEGLLLSCCGFLAGIILSRTGLLIISSQLKADYHYSFSGWGLMAEEWLLFAVAIGIGLLAAGIPAIRVFNINISKTLADA